MGMIVSSHDFLPILVNGDRRVIVQTLGHQLQSERIFLPARLFDFRSFILEPDLDLRLVQSQISRELLPPSLGQISIFREFPLQSCQLFRAERGSRPLLFRRAILPVVRSLHPPRSRSCKSSVNCSLIYNSILGNHSIADSIFIG